MDHVFFRRGNTCEVLRYMLEGDAEKGSGMLCSVVHFIKRMCQNLGHVDRVGHARTGILDVLHQVPRSTIGLGAGVQIAGGNVVSGRAT